MGNKIGHLIPGVYPEGNAAIALASSQPMTLAQTVPRPQQQMGLSFSSGIDTFYQHTLDLFSFSLLSRPYSPDSTS